MRRTCNKEPSFGNYKPTVFNKSCIVSKYSYWFEIVYPFFFTTNNTCINFTNKLWLNLGNNLAITQWFVLVPIFWSSINIWDIPLAEIFRTFKIRFKIKCTHDSDMSTALATSRIVYLPSLSIISRLWRHLPCFA